MPEFRCNLSFYVVAPDLELARSDLLAMLRNLEEEALVSGFVVKDVKEID